MTAQLELSAKRLPGESKPVPPQPALSALTGAPTFVASLDGLSLVFGGLALLAGGAIAWLVVSLSGSTTFLLLGVIGLFAALGIFARTEWGLLLLAFMAYTQLSNVAIQFHGAPSLAQPFVALLLAIIFVRWFLYGQRPSGWVRPTLVLGGYGLVGVASLLYAADPARTLGALEDYLKEATIAAAAMMLLQRATTLRRVIWALLAAGILMGTISVYQHLAGTFNDTYWGFGRTSVVSGAGNTNDYRIAGPVGDPNFYAQILVVLVPLALDRLWGEQKRWLRLFAAWAFAVCTLSILFTDSRGGFLALVVVLALILARRRPNLLTLLVTIALVMPLLQFVPANYVERIKTIPEALPFSASKPTDDESFRGRTSENLAAWMMFKERPFLGVGLNNYPVYYQDYSRLLGMDPRREGRYPHSLYLQIAAETGLLGLSVFGLLAWVIFRGLRRAQILFEKAQMPDYAGIAVALSVGLIGYLSAALFLHLAYPRPWWLLVGIALAVPHVAQRELDARREVSQNDSR